jgi:HSP20 family molecular chaperone IbpA
MTEKNVNSCQQNRWQKISNICNKIKQNNKYALLFLFGVTIGFTACTFYKKEPQKVNIVRFRHHPFFWDDFYYQYEPIVIDQPIHSIDESQSANKKASKIYSSLQQKQDQDYHYYNLQFSGIDPQQIEVKIENNQLIFTAKNDLQSQENDSSLIKHSFSSSSLYYSISLPKHYKDPEVIKSNQEISVKFVKIKK